jgi:hypothetical protein
MPLLFPDTEKSLFDSSVMVCSLVLIYLCVHGFVSHCASFRLQDKYADFSNRSFGFGSGEELYQQYVHGGSGLPHMFYLVAKAMRCLQYERAPQSILINGESGSGKSENTKNALRWLAHTCACPTAAFNTKILNDACLLLEAFGNAKTVNNDNSSRFGKLVEIAFLCPQANGGTGRPT